MGIDHHDFIDVHMHVTRPLPPAAEELYVVVATSSATVSARGDSAAFDRVRWGGSLRRIVCRGTY